jgi:hypothetical protein
VFAFLKALLSKTVRLNCEVRVLQKTPLIIVSTIALLSVGGMAIAVINQISTQTVQPPAVADLAYPFDKCYPSAFERPTEVKQSHLGSVTWWEVKAKSVRYKNSLSLLHFRTEDRKCKWSNRNRPTFRLDYMPKSRAVDFAMQHYQPMLEACKKVNSAQPSVDAFCIKEMQNGLKESRFFPEEVEALSALKIDVNAIENHQIISSSENIQSEN